MKTIEEALRPLNPKQRGKVAKAIRLGLPVVVAGKSGQTGKTTLTNNLRAVGVKAAELWELEEKEDDKNTAGVFIVLNQRISSGFEGNCGPVKAAQLQQDHPDSHPAEEMQENLPQGLISEPDCKALLHLFPMMESALLESRSRIESHEVPKPGPEYNR